MKGPFQLMHVTCWEVGPSVTPSGPLLSRYQHHRLLMELLLPDGDGEGCWHHAFCSVNLYSSQFYKNLRNIFKLQFQTMLTLGLRRYLSFLSDILSLQMALLRRVCQVFIVSRVP